MLRRCIVGDWWRDPPKLDFVSRTENWFQMQFMQTQYFRDTAAFEKGVAEATRFNVFRPLEFDSCTSQFWDTSPEPFDSEVTVELMRTRASYWLQPKSHLTQGEDTAENLGSQVGIVLLDPTPQSGNPIWMQTRNWAKTPSFHSTAPSTNESPPTKNLFEEFVYWATTQNQLVTQEAPKNRSITEVPTAVLLHVMCTQWLTFVDYLNTRFNQIEALETLEFGQILFTQLVSRQNFSICNGKPLPIRRWFGRPFSSSSSGTSMSIQVISLQEDSSRATSRT